MDVDCDGANRTGGDCSNDPSGQDETAFKDTIQSYGIEDLDANLHSYVVFGTADYDPSNDGLNPLSIMAIVCNDQLVSNICSIRMPWLISFTLFSFTVSGEIPMVSALLERPLSLWLSYVSPMMV